MKSPVYFADQNFRLVKKTDNQFVVVQREPASNISKGLVISSSLGGIYQEKNFITACQVISLLRKEGYDIKDEAIQSGFKDVLKNTGMQGRWQLLLTDPKTICDIGHNEAGFESILAQLKKEEYKKLHWVFGIVNDKDANKLLSLLPIEATYYFCKADIPRGLDVEELWQKAKSLGLEGNKYRSVQEAYMAAKKAAGESDLVFVGGSTFVVAEVL
jgi:dihydrofolate synthase/folylpolyglutamate synthase